MKNLRLFVLAVLAVACITVDAQAGFRPLRRARDTVKGAVNGALDGFKQGSCHNGVCRPHSR